MQESVTASSFSACVQRFKSKCCSALPTDAETFRVFKKTLIGGYSCVNTRMTFDTCLFSKDIKNEKVLFKTAHSQLKRFSSKIIKMDEKNQYGQTMTKPLLYGCIKRKNKALTLEELLKLLKSVTLDDKIGHIFTLDMEFSVINHKTLLIKEIYPPIFEKNFQLHKL